MTPVHFLIDTSALVRVLRDGDVRDRWRPHITAGLVGVCPLTELEFLYSATSKADRQERQELLASAFAWVGVPDGVYRRAGEVQATLTDRGAHRSAGVVDLLLAATAELNRLTLIHYDRDFDEIAKATGQAVAWVAAPGSIS